MKILANREIRRLFTALALIWALAMLLTAGWAWLYCRRLTPCPVLIPLLAGGGALAVCLAYFKRQHRTMEQAVGQINAYLSGDVNARIECDSEGEMYRLFHAVNSLAAVLNAHADNEQREKEFLKNTISDISHQLKTPLAALNVYNGLIQDGDSDDSAVKEFAALSEKELDRIETLVQNLLKITRLDAGAIVFEKREENAADMLRETVQQFAYRAGQEQKTLTMAGDDGASLFCDRGWLCEAIGNIVKNALDHTGAGEAVSIEWRALPAAVQIVITDSGCGIHPEDLPHIFKRFYRSRFSKNTQGAGLGLPLAKAIVEAHGGTIEVDSEPGKGAAFTMYFPEAAANPTKL